jgi:hypothetical protein
MIHITEFEKKQLRLIASFYGCKLKFSDKVVGGFWYGDSITMCTKRPSFASIVSVFFHELAHFINWKTGKYPLYHNLSSFNKLDKIFPSYKRRVRYCLNAEICTEKLGEKLLKQWMPGIKYKVYYKNTKVCYEFLYGYYL